MIHGIRPVVAAVAALNLAYFGVVAGLGITAINPDAPREVFQRARGEWRGTVRREA